MVKSQNETTKTPSGKTFLRVKLVNLFVECQLNCRSEFSCEPNPVDTE